MQRVGVKLGMNVRPRPAAENETPEPGCVENRLHVSHLGPSPGIQDEMQSREQRGDLGRSSAVPESNRICAGTEQGIPRAVRLRGGSHMSIGCSTKCRLAVASIACLLPRSNLSYLGPYKMKVDSWSEK